MGRSNSKHRAIRGRKATALGHRRPVKNKNLPRTAAEFFAKPTKFQDQWVRMTHVISKMRADGVSLAHAARDFGIDPRTVIRWGGPALKKDPAGRYSARNSDRLLRVLL